MTPEQRGRISRCKVSIRVWWYMEWKDSITSAHAKNCESLTNSKWKRWRLSADPDRKNYFPKNYKPAKVRTIGAKFRKAFSKDHSNDHCSQHYRSAQYFHGIAAHADVGNAVAFPRCSDMHLAWPTALNSLANQHLLVALCDSVFH